MRGFLPNSPGEGSSGTAVGGPEELGCRELDGFFKPSSGCCTSQELVEKQDGVSNKWLTVRRGTCKHLRAAGTALLVGF